MKKRSKIKFLNFITFIAIMFLAGNLIPKRISVTITPSLKNRIYLLDRYPTKESIKANSYVLFTLESELIKDAKTHNVIKKVACTEGDDLTVRGLSYYCEGQYMGLAKEYTLEGIELDHFVYEGIIPEGKIFLFSNHIDSYDSRYYGFLEKKDVLAIAHPML